MDDLQSKDTQILDSPERQVGELEEDVLSRDSAEISDNNQGGQVDGPQELDNSSQEDSAKEIETHSESSLNESSSVSETTDEIPDKEVSDEEFEQNKLKKKWNLPSWTSLKKLGDAIFSPAATKLRVIVSKLKPTAAKLKPTVDMLKKSLEQEEPAMRRRRNRHRMKQETAAKRIVRVVVVIVLLALVITGYSGYSYIKTSLDPIDAKATTTIQIEIPEGSSTKEIGNILVDNHLIKNATIFNYYSKLKSYNNFQSGFYNLDQSMSVDELAKALQESGAKNPVEPVAGKVLIIEGYTLEQIAKAVTDNVNTGDKGDKTGFSSEEFLETVTNTEFINKMVAKYPNLFASLPATDSGVKYQLEGYLFPATYEYGKETSMEELVEKMIAAMDANLQAYYGQLADKGLNVNQVLTLASLVEKEGATDEDRRNIASVFFNRLNINMPLQSNIAILYAMGKLGEKTTLAEDAAIDTNIDSPYNIYVHTGLMPGPVVSPSLAAIEATVNPNQTGYYYFVADVTTGTVYYSATIEEHNQNVEKYVNSKLNQ